MRQYEIAIRIAQVHHLADERKYKKALAVIQTLDMRQVRNVSDLKVFAEVYTRTEQFDAAKATYLRIYKKSRTRRVLYRLIYLAIRTNNLQEAEGFYHEFVRMNPNNRDALILRYRIDKAAGVPIGQLIDILKALKEEEYIEEWAYELAKLYQQAGRYEECREECEDIKLWFGQGEIVERAKLLLEHIQENNPLPFMDDVDYTVKREKPNPDDTGSLPDLNEYLQSNNEEEMKLLKKVDPEKFEETRVERIQEEQHLAQLAEEQAEEAEADDAQEQQEVSEESSVSEADAAEDDEDEFEDNDDADLSKMAKEGIHKLSDLLFGGKKDEETDEPIEEQESSEDKAVEEQAEETADEVKETAKTAEELPPKKDIYNKIDTTAYPRISQSGTGITQDLAAEISAIFEAEHQEQLKEKAVMVYQEVPNKTNEVFERMTEEAEGKTPTKEYVPLENRGKTAESPDDMAKTNVIPTLDVPERMEAVETRVVQPEQISRDVLEQAATTVEPENTNVAAQQAAPIMEEIKPQQMPVEEMAADTQQSGSLSVEQQNYDTVQPSMKTAQQQVAEATAQQPVAGQQPIAEAAAQQPVPEQQPVAEVVAQQPVPEQQPTPEQALVRQLEQEVEQLQQEQEDILSESATGEVLPEKDLPTTRALHRSFADILILIGGELDPSHFVLMGDGEERILGISKKIATVMRETGYLSAGRIARIGAEQLNQMDIMQFKQQLKGNCLLVTRAADLLFPTITKIFSIMDEYYGDFAVILSDEGATLDQLFRFVPALARRFKYIIDISQYTEQDYR